MLRFLVILLFISSVQAFETKSDEMSFDLNSKTCILQGNAEVKFKLKGDCVFKSNCIEIKYKDKNFKTPENLVAKGNVIFFNENIEIKSENCKSDMNKIEFFDKVSIKSSEFGEITADNAFYDIKLKKISITSKNKVKLKINDEKSKKLIQKVKK